MEPKVNTVDIETIPIILKCIKCGNTFEIKAAIETIRYKYIDLQELKQIICHSCQDYINKRNFENEIEQTELKNLIMKRFGIEVSELEQLKLEINKFYDEIVIKDTYEELTKTYWVASQ